MALRTLISRLDHDGGGNELCLLVGDHSDPSQAGVRGEESHRDCAVLFCVAVGAPSLLPIHAYCVVKILKCPIVAIRARNANLCGRVCAARGQQRPTILIPHHRKTSPSSMRLPYKKQGTGARKWREKVRPNFFRFSSSRQLLRAWYCLLSLSAQSRLFFGTLGCPGLTVFCVADH